MSEITMPDFREWSERLMDNHYMYDGRPIWASSIEEALKQAFDQGRYLGQRLEGESCEKAK